MPDEARCHTNSPLEVISQEQKSTYCLRWISFPRPPRNTYTNGETDLSLLGRCPASSHPKHGTCPPDAIDPIVSNLNCVRYNWSCSPANTRPPRNTIEGICRCVEPPSCFFDNYARDAMAFFETTDRLVTLVGQDDAFEEARKHAEQAREKCSASRNALEQHLAQHNCRASAQT
jgi:hypothetical protein